MRKIPLRFTTLHLEQRFLIDDETFTTTSPSIRPAFHVSPAKVSIIHAVPCLVQSDFLCHGTVRITGPFSVIATVCS